MEGLLTKKYDFNGTIKKRKSYTRLFSVGLKTYLHRKTGNLASVLDYKLYFRPMIPKYMEKLVFLMSRIDFEEYQDTSTIYMYIFTFFIQEQFF